MDGAAGRDGLSQGLESMIALESRLEKGLARLRDEAKGYLEAPTVIERLHSIARGQREALQAHLPGLAQPDIPPLGSTISAAFEATDPAGGKDPGGAIGSLRALATAFAQGAFGYAVLHALAHRSYEVTIADLADEHRRNYLRAAQAIQQAVGGVAAEELHEAGHICRCECPACDPGICLCWHVHVDPEATGLEALAEGITVRTPRAESNAERAGLRAGDVITAVDGREVRSYQDMLDRMRDHEPGEEVELRVRRGSGDPQELLITR